MKTMCPLYIAWTFATQIMWAEMEAVISKV